MKTLLRIDTSVAGTASVSSKIMDDLVDKLSEKDQLNVISRNLDKESVPHFDGQWIEALTSDEGELNEQAMEKRAYSNEQIRQIKSANIIVIAAPMYNFSIPSVLKAWFDHIARAGETFRYTSNGPEGLLKNKKVYLVTTRGGIHENKPTDSLIPFVKTFLAFVGLNDVEIIYAEGLNMGNGEREKGLNQASEAIEKLIAA